MRRKKIRTHAEANRFLKEEYLPEHNRRFAQTAAAAEDYHRKAPSQAERWRIFRLETERTIGNDWVVRYENRFFQLKRQRGRYAPAKSKVCEWQDGSVEIEYRGQALAWKELGEAPARQAVVAKPTPVSRRRPRVPPADHPWRQEYQRIPVSHRA
jgi:hypothetical protein